MGCAILFEFTAYEMITEFTKTCGPLRYQQLRWNCRPVWPTFYSGEPKVQDPSHGLAREGRWPLDFVPCSVKDRKGNLPRSHLAAGPSALSPKSEVTVKRIVKQ